MWRGAGGVDENKKKRCAGTEPRNRRAGDGTPQPSCGDGTPPGCQEGGGARGGVGDGGSPPSRPEPNSRAVKREEIFSFEDHRFSRICLPGVASNKSSHAKTSMACARNTQVSQSTCLSP